MLNHDEWLRFYLELQECEFWHLNVEGEIRIFPHRVEPVVPHVLGLALVVGPGVVGMAADADLEMMDGLPYLTQGSRKENTCLYKRLHFYILKV